jgi:predicted nucleic acid-binding protein
MVTTFFDSSVLAAFYLAEPHSAAARGAVTRVPVVPFTALHHLEVRNAFRLLVGWKRMTAGQLAAVLARLDEDIAAGRLAQTPVDLGAVFSRAEELSERHSRRLLTRSLDVLHVAAALELSCLRFVTLDTRQGRLAAACGLKVVNLRTTARAPRPD